MQFTNFYTNLDNVPEGEIVGELHSDIDKYDFPDHEQPEGTKKRETKEVAKKADTDKEDKHMFDSKDQYTILRNKIDKGVVDEHYRKDTFKEKTDLNKTLGNASKTFKKKKKRNDNKRRKVADEEEEEY